MMDNILRMYNDVYFIYFRIENLSSKKKNKFQISHDLLLSNIHYNLDFCVTINLVVHQ